MFSTKIHRRGFLAAGVSAGMGACSTLDAFSTSIAPKIRQHSPKVKSVIWLFMNGGPSSVDLFDPKPTLDKWDGKKFPGKIETLFPHPGPIMRSPFRFKKHGESGQSVSECFPNIAKQVDKLTFLKSCFADSHNHTPACYMVNSGVTKAGSPCLGSWISYGLSPKGSELPGFVIMHDQKSAPEGGANLWASAYLPGEYQGLPFRSSSQPILYLNRSQKISRKCQAAQLKMLDSLNRKHQDKFPHPEFASRQQSFEVASNLQASLPQIADLGNETAETHRLYGLDQETTQPFGRQLLSARKLVENGVPMIQIYHGGWKSNWDNHSALEEQHRDLCASSDRPIAGLLTDLHRRGLLEETLVIWGGEFGRTPTSQDRNGRDHNPFGFTMWMAGGGLKKGISYGETDDFGYHAVENRVSIHDLHATILHLLGLNHEELTFRYGGREQSLVSGLGDVVTDILA
ncbi:MAG: DUF1501 domain-containing protein [Planctomycetota bacterium]|nr:DUF1501 domain-containing protein [Planctomycetota bacterium]